MTKLSDVQIAQYAFKAGFRNSPVHQNLTMAVAIALAESGGDTAVTHKNSDSRGTTDLGVWQINNYWHRDLLTKYSWSDPLQNAQMAFIIVGQSNGTWTQWSTFNSGSFFKYMARAIKAATAVQSGTATTLPQDVNTPAGDMGAGSSASDGATASITNPHTWLRVAMVGTGMVLVLVSLAMLGWEGAPPEAKSLAKSTAKTAAKTAVKAAVL